VRCVVVLWLVINPLSRYRHAKRAQAGANPPEWPKSIIARQDAYWQSEANMAEGNPTLILERGEKVLTPPAVWSRALSSAGLVGHIGIDIHIDVIHASLNSAVFGATEPPAVSGDGVAHFGKGEAAPLACLK
jgi:hypothetical protein